MATQANGPYREPPKQKRKRAKIHHRRELRVATGSPKAEINITPLVDVVLVLLIIFMVITPMLHRGVKIELPETAHHEKKQDTGEQLVVSVRTDGVYIETDKLEGERLMEKLRAELKTPTRPVHVRADKGLSYGDVRKVLEKIHEAGAISVALGTDEKKE